MHSLKSSVRQLLKTATESNKESTTERRGQIQILQTSSLHLLVLGASESQGDRSSFPRNSHLLSQHSRAATTSQPWSAQWNKNTYCGLANHKNERQVPFNPPPLQPQRVKPACEYSSSFVFHSMPLTNPPPFFLSSKFMHLHFFCHINS
ncbi:uncharacterized protein LOC114962211 [Acropora millepora]|uniref:uncharacterized protein LOC114951621 n=1 Tax=Acropora millepora TaxID=45264 RepID=UPI001CF50DD7|nr:uncharacterized protein LOC114951621 [Acropora millepora]XP_044171796.1 uncharacterized protein LOC114962211 [Acropora millepora]XP_044171797.1 uncharacterized protein LOC114962211 [Acropora millepora]